MNILLIGTGAIGLFFGGHIARYSKKAKITFFSRGNSYDMIKASGIKVKSSIIESFAVKVSVIEALPSEPDYDLVILATKSYDVEGLLSKLPKNIFARSFFMTTQNGVSSEDLLLNYIAKDKLIPASALVGLRKTNANTVNHMGGGRFQLGSYEKGKNAELVKNLYNILKESGIDTYSSEDIMHLKWGKLVWNAAYNPLSTITQKELGQLIQSEHGLSLLRGSMNETALIARQSGYSISDNFINKQLNLPKHFYGFKTSMLQDYLNNRPLELDAILGDLLLKAKKHGINSPINSYCYKVINILLDQTKTKTNNAKN